MVSIASLPVLVDELISQLGALKMLYLFIKQSCTIKQEKIQSLMSGVVWQEIR